MYTLKGYKISMLYSNNQHVDNLMIYCYVVKIFNLNIKKNMK